MSIKGKRKYVNQRSSYRKSSNLRVPFIGGGLLAALLLFYLIAALYYKSHFFGNSVINGIKTTNMTVSEAQAAISTEVDTYRLTLEGRNNSTDSILGSNIDLHTEFSGCIDELLSKQNAFAWPVYLFRTQNYEVDTMLAYDEELLKLCFDRLNYFDEANIIEPMNATLSAYGENGYEIIPENQGTKVIKDKLYVAVVNAIDTLQASISLEEAKVYEEPEITSDYPAMIKALNEMNKLAGTEVTYHFGDVTEVLDGTIISQWISVDNEYNVSFNEDGVKEYVDYIGKTYNSFGRIRTFKTSYGDEIKVEGGDYGWWLNRPKEREELIVLIRDGVKQVREPVYFQTAQQYGADDIGGTYVEINLTAQHLFFYKDGEMVLESDFVSGNVSKNYATPTGTYPIQYKENDATLVGEDYETPVKYWMPFNKNIGLHDASWRSAFGKDIYLTRGSHGCINMPPENAKKLFKDIKRGVAVVVYELPGTENYEVKEEKPPKKTDTKASDSEKTDTEKTDTEDSDNTESESSEEQ